ncbi:MAG: hypothetical protein Q7T03_01930 [Deltaproteobacteria bacterium]|nr:hypothetical protein [Deltaproteobacteria bacterium]
MPKVQLPNVEIPYEKGREPLLVDPTEGDAPDGLNHVLTAQDIADTVSSPSIYELVRHDQKTDLVAQANRMVIQAARWSLDPHRVPALFKNSDMHVSVTPEEAGRYSQRLTMGPSEQRAFVRYIQNSKQLDPFVSQIFEAMAWGQDDNKLFLAAQLFNQLLPQKQKEVLTQFSNLGAGARMLYWAEFFSEDKQRFAGNATQWAMGDDRVALMLGLREGLCLDIHERTFDTPFQKILVVDDLLCAFADYYDNFDYETLVRFLNSYKSNGVIHDWQMSHPNAYGVIENTEVRCASSLDSLDELIKNALSRFVGSQVFFLLPEDVSALFSCSQPVYVGTDAVVDAGEVDISDAGDVEEPEPGEEVEVHVISAEFEKARITIEEAGEDIDSGKVLAALSKYDQALSSLDDDEERQEIYARVEASLNERLGPESSLLPRLISELEIFKQDL